MKELLAGGVEAGGYCCLLRRLHQLGTFQGGGEQVQGVDRHQVHASDVAIGAQCVAASASWFLSGKKKSSVPSRAVVCPQREQL